MSRVKVNLALLTFLFIVIHLWPVPLAAQQVISFNHQAERDTQTKSVYLEDGEQFVIQIADTYPQCFSYNATAVKATAPSERASTGLEVRTVTFNLIHSSEFGKYVISISPRRSGGAAEDGNCNEVWDTLGSQEKEILVHQSKWTAGVAGAFTYDEITNPVFYLESATRTGSDGTSESGFLVRENSRDRDGFSLGGATMIHLFHSNPSRFKISRYAMQWAPLSFGIGLTDSETKYLLGSSLRFGDQAFLTVGGAFGRESRLPSGLSRGGFTTDANALANLGKRSAKSIFVGISYTFLGSKDDISKRFNAFKPTEANAKDEKATQKEKEKTDRQ
jgi:hypothetical protein